MLCIHKYVQNYIRYIIDYQDRFEETSKIVNVLVLLFLKIYLRTV